jgi:glycosyltransferase involved in cell wall biosynthesis
MARIGMNPARHRKSDYRPARVTAAVLVYIPHLSGYFTHRLDVLRLCLRTLIEHTEEPHDLLIFDNDSCDEVKDYLAELLEKGEVRYLISSSENIGKLGALRIIANAIPGEVLAYCDDDTFFYPGWLKSHLELLDAFPNVGMVSGSPERTLFDHGIESNLRFAQSDVDAQLSYGQTIPEQWEEEWAHSLGKDIPAFLAQVGELQDIIIERNGVRAYATACHNQFIMPKCVAQEFLQGEWTGRLMGGMNEFDNAIDEAGYLRLTTLERTTRLIGNLVSPALANEAGRFSLDFEISNVEASRGPSRLLRIKPVHWFLQGLYNRLFSLLSGQGAGWYEQETEEDE